MWVGSHHHTNQKSVIVVVRLGFVGTTMNEKENEQNTFTATHSLTYLGF